MTRRLPELARHAVRRLHEPRVAWAVLGFAMLVSAGLILYTARGQGFAVDEIFYYGRVAQKQGDLVHYAPFSPEYLFAPFNGHLPFGGRFVYEAIFATFGAKYTVFLLINIASLWACVGVTFELIRRRIGAIAALAPCIVLLFLGFAREQLLWPLDFNTAASLAAGLAAVLALERDDRRGEILACLLLTLSVAMIELGLSFAVGIAVWLLIRHRADALRRAWIVLVPIALYAIWWIWARKFDQSETTAGNLHLLPETFLDGAAAVMGALTGTSPVQPGAYVSPLTWFGKALAVAAGVVLIVRLWLGKLPRTIWVWLIVLGSYWSLLAVAARPAEGGRYILVGAVLIVLIAADAVGRRISDGVAIALLLLALVALPANIAQLTEGRDNDTLHHDPPVSQTEFAMLELAREHVAPDYFVTGDPRVAEVDGGLFIGITADAYLDAAAHNGSFSYSLEEVREQDEDLRLIADAALVGALAVEIEPTSAPGPGAKCRSVAPTTGDDSASFDLGPGRILLRPAGNDQTALWLARFADSPRSVGIDYLPPSWSQLVIPGDEAPDRWRLTVDGPVTVCSTG
jgi:glycerol-3-phosphate acyltransferase PlsY